MRGNEDSLKRNREGEINMTTDTIDTDKLLAKVKRLDAIIRDIESLIPENPDYVCEQILGACHRYMHPEEFGEVSDACVA